MVTRRRTISRGDHKSRVSDDVNNAGMLGTVGGGRGRETQGTIRDTVDSFKRELISHLGWDRAVWKKGPAGSCERPRVISRANGVTVAGARGMRYPALSLSL